jgi:hypothetical protein
MGFASYFEDDRDRWQERNLTARSWVEPEWQSARADVVWCPLCDAELDAKAYQDHWWSAHRRFGAWLRANGQVITEGAAVEPPINEFVLEYVVDDSARAELRVDGAVITERTLDRPGPWNLLPEMKRDLPASIQVDVWRGRAHVITMHVVFGPRSAEPRIPMLSAAVEEFMHGLASGVGSDWARFGSVTRDPQWTIQERAYLEGMYAYCYALELDDRGKVAPARRQYQLAFSLIRPFGTGPARAALPALALRMNWFGLLAGCPDSSSFAGAARYFHPRTSAHGAALYSRSRGGEPHEGIRIATTDVQIAVLKAIDAATANSWDEVEDVTSGALQVARELDVLDRAKLTLIRARAYRDSGRSNDANETYRLLRDDPTFRGEAMTYA